MIRWLKILILWNLIVGLGLMQGLVLTIPAKPIVQDLLDQGLIVVTAGKSHQNAATSCDHNKNVDEAIDLLEKTLNMNN